MSKALFVVVLIYAFSKPCCCFTGRAASLVPDWGAWFGVTENWNPNVTSYVENFGLEPAVYSYYIKIPFLPADRINICNWIEQLAPARPIVLLTVEPYLGLETVTDVVITDLAMSLGMWEAKGVTFIVRFAQEMNGCW